jgi:hypothetical protein
MSTNPFADVTSFEELNELFQTRLQTWAVECTKRHECIQLTVRYLEACKPFIAGFARQQLQVRNRDEFERVLLILKDSETGDDFRTVHDVIFPSSGRESLLWYNPIQLDTLARMVLDKLMRGVRIPVVQQAQVSQQTPTSLIDVELDRALQNLLPSSSIEVRGENRAPVNTTDEQAPVGQSDYGLKQYLHLAQMEEGAFSASFDMVGRINDKKLEAGKKLSLQDQTNFVDPEMQRAMEESMLDEARRQQAIEDSMLAEAMRRSMLDQPDGHDFMDLPEGHDFMQE